MNGVRALPRWIQWPVITLVVIAAGAASIWATLPDSSKTQLISQYVFSTSSRTEIFPSVEHQEAKYEIALDEKGGATWNLHFKFRRLREEAQILADMIATSGPKPEIYSGTHSLKIKKSTEAVKKQPTLDRYLVMADISKEALNEDRPAHIRYITSGGFTGTPREWGGVLVLQPTRKAIVKIVFQPGKMGKDFELSKHSWSAPENPTPLDQKNERINVTANAIQWEIDYPQLNYVYRIGWTW